MLWSPAQLQQFSAARARIHNTAIQKATSSGNSSAVTALNEQISLVIQQEDHIKLIRAMLPPTPDEMKRPVLKSAVEMYDRLSFQLRYYYIACTRSWETARLWKGQDFESRDARLKRVMHELEKKKEKPGAGAGKRKPKRFGALFSSGDVSNTRQKETFGPSSSLGEKYPTTSRGIPKVPGSCWKCGSFSHMAPQCPRRAN